MKKLLCKKGSVLFLVVVVMSILIIAASATFYIVNNQTNSVNVRYSSEQSYQTALSVSDTVSDYIDGYIAAISSSGKEMTKYKDTVIGKMVSMSTGTSNDITSDIPLDSSMGTAKVTIRKTSTKNSGDNTVHIFEITTDSEVNGETVTITQVKEIITGPTEYFTRFLTSTGKHPDDVNITADKIISSAYFENDFTRLSNATMNESLYSSGTFYNNGIIFNAPTKEIVIAENFYNYGFGQSVECGKIYVGGNLESSSTFTANEIYVLGDVTFKQDLTGGTYYVNGNVYLDNINTNDCIFYVNGNVYFSNINKPQGKFYVKKDVILNNWQWASLKECKYGGALTGTTTATTFSHDTDIGTPFADTAKISAYIASATGKQKYEKWSVEEYFVNSFTDYVENVVTDPGDGHLVSYNIKNAVIPGERSDTWVDGDPAADKPAWIDGHDPVAGQKHTYIKSPYGGLAICYISESCALRSWTNDSFNATINWNGGTGTHPFYTNGGKENYIVIDTGSKRPGGKEIYILLDKGTNSYFSFGADNTIQFVNVIIKGDYPVIFIIPEGTSYKTSAFLYVGHANLAAKMCGCTDYNDLISSQRQLFSQFTGKTSVIEGFIDIQSAADPKMQPTALIKSGSGIPDFHNNIFLVSNSNKDIVDMNSMNIFYGYLYAPNTKLNVDLGGGGGALDVIIKPSTGGTPTLGYR